jgi:iron complex transport system ATP-binding protein
MSELHNIIELKNLEIGYSSGIKGFKILIQSINLSSEKGQLTAIIGRNGSGKSTLLKTITRLTDFKKGDILINNRNIKNVSRAEFAQIVSFVSTELLNISNIKVTELITLGRSPYTNWLGKPVAADKSIVNEAIELLDLKSFSDKYFYNLSDGEKQKVMIARALAQDTEVLLLDEPTAFLDLPNKYEIIDILNYLAKKKNKTIIFSTHDLNIAINAADKIWFINNNLIIDGTPEEIMLNESFEGFLKVPKSIKNRFNWHYSIKA